MDFKITGADTPKKELWQELDAKVLSGGFKLDKTSLISTLTVLPKGCPMNVDYTTRIAKLVKTVKCITGGAANAPRVAKGSQFKVGEFITDGYISTEITSIVTTETTYDTINLTASLKVYAADTALYEGAAEEASGSAPSIATVEEVSTKTILVSEPFGRLNGIDLTLAQNSSDDLAVAYASGVLSIKLADTTSASNTAVLIQAAIRSLGTIEGIDFSMATVVGTNWTTITGGTITTALDVFKGGVVRSYTPALLETSGLLKNDVAITATNTPSCSVIIEAREVKESDLTYPLHAIQKVELTSRFLFI